MSVPPRITDKRNAHRALLDWLIEQLSQFVPFSYDIYCDERHEEGLAPLTKGEFTWWLWYYDRKWLIDPYWAVEKHTEWDRFDRVNSTYYYWRRRDHGTQEAC